MLKISYFSQQCFAKILRLFSVLLIAGLSVTCTDDEITGAVLTSNPMKDDFDRKIDAIITPYAYKKATASVAVAVFKDDVTRYYTYGEKQKGSNNLPDSLSYYEIGSITKTFTGIMMTDYLLKNNISIETPINSFLPSNLPELKFAGESIKIKHLLNHTAGLPNLPSDCDICNPTQLYDSTRTYNYLKTLKLSVKPGTKYAYSNLGMGLVGTILERATKKTYSRLLEEIITNPLGLKHTKLELNSTDSLNMVTGYDNSGKVASYSPNYWNFLSGFKGSGAIKSNMVDMINYGKAILNPNPTSLSNPISLCTSTSFEDANKHGFDWVTLNCNGQEVLFHDGGTAGFSSHIFVCPSKKIVVVLLFSNVSDKIPEYMNELAMEIIK